MNKLTILSISLILLTNHVYGTTDTMSSINIIGISNDFNKIAYLKEGYSGDGDYEQIIIRSLKEPATERIHTISHDKKDNEINKMIYDLDISSNNLKYLIELKLNNQKYHFNKIGYFYTREDKKGDIFNLIFHNNKFNTDEIVLEISHNYFNNFIKPGYIEYIYNEIKIFYYSIDPKNKDIFYLYVIIRYKFDINGSA